MMTALDAARLEEQVKQMYREVALHPEREFHFEMGRAVAERLGYPPEQLDRVPQAAVDSFAGVGYVFGLARLGPGERVVDLGSGSGMDALLAAILVGPSGRVTGVDFTPEQVRKGRLLAAEAGIGNIEFLEARIEELPVGASTVDCVISNGVVNLSPRKTQVFAEAARVLRPRGRLAIADIISERRLSEAIVGNADLWAACIGGAAQQDDYRSAVEAAGFEVKEVVVNPYAFISEQARSASRKYGVQSVSLLATSP